MDPGARAATALSGPDCDRTILELARDQHGVVGRRQLIDAGVSSSRIDYRLRTGRLSTLFRGVYAVGPITDPLQRPMAAALAAGDDAWVGFRSAVALWEFGRSAWSAAPQRAPFDSGAPIHILALRDIRSSDPGLRFHRTATLAPDDVTVRHGVPVTRPARTILDFATHAPRRDLEYAIGRAHRAGQLQPDDLRHLLVRFPRRRGVRLLRQILDEMSDPPFVRSEAEHRLFALLRTAGLPLPRLNVRVLGYEVDFYYPDERLVIEVDGRAYHSGDPAFERDHERDNTLTAAGYEVIRLTWRRITREPDAVIGLVARTLGRRSR